MKPGFCIFAVVILLVNYTYTAALTNETSPEDIFKKAIENLNKGNIETAITQMETLLNFAPQSKDYYEYLGYLYFVQGSYQKAVEVMKNVLQLDSNSIIAYFILGEIFYQQNEIVKAREIYSKLVQIEPELKIAHIRLYELLKNNNPREANKHYLKVFRLAPTKIEKYLPGVEDIDNIVHNRNIVLIKDLGIEKKIKVKEDVLESIFSDTDKSTNSSAKSVILTIKKRKGIKLNFKFFTSPFKDFDKETFYVKFVEIIFVSMMLLINSLFTKKKKDRLKRIVVSNYRIGSQANKSG